MNSIFLYIYKWLGIAARLYSLFSSYCNCTPFFDIAVYDSISKRSFNLMFLRRGYRGGSSKKRQEQRRFAMYGAYAWGVPLLLTGLTAFMQFGDLPDYIMKPGLGDMKCWFEGEEYLSYTE